MDNLAVEEARHRLHAIDLSLSMLALARRALPMRYVDQRVQSYDASVADEFGAVARRLGIIRDEVKQEMAKAIVAR